MIEKERNLVGKGEFDYDYYSDILFFKVKNREYKKSIEFENLVIDIDEENFVVGLQIFDASEYFGIRKQFLKIAMRWKLKARVNRLSKTQSRIEIRLMFQIKVRNKILQPEPIITHDVKDSLGNSNMICVPVKQ
ncbi:MAG: DUF2283 domain-containing protein [Candidatus Aenigmarchaeota archaeon]|nr:DUF2283 domain-containing protein [Candidatus Aenigmarchaeota archaeon]